MTTPPSPRFTKAIGRWAGNAEVFDGTGRFLGNGSDYRHVQELEDGRVRIDVSFVGPFKHSGHYVIQPGDGYRLYQGPANIGYAETLSAGLVDANAYWPALGLSQRFFLMVVDETLQLSLAHMSRGERLLYVVVGQNNRVPDGDAPAQPAVVSGIHYDLQDDPAAGRPQLWLHRPGQWDGELTALDGDGQPLGQSVCRQTITRPAPGQLVWQTEGGAFDPSPLRLRVTTDQWHGWTSADSDLVGSYSLSGGRALSGRLYQRQSHLHCWQREVATLDGARKAVVQQWYRGSRRVGVQFGVLDYSE
jgi:hypothetical protein